jgi:hypothetical protein
MHWVSEHAGSARILPPAKLELRMRDCLSPTLAMQALKGMLRDLGEQVRGSGSDG